MFSVLRGAEFFTTFAFHKFNWCVKNRKYFKASPLFWVRCPNFKRLFPNQLALLNAYQLQENIPTASLKKYFVKKLEKLGTCHGQCLAILEQTVDQISQFKSIVPKDLLNAVKTHPQRVMYYQMLEVIRGSSLDMQKSAWEYLPTFSEFLQGLNFSDKEAIETQLSIPAFYIVRYCDPKKNTAHSLVYYTFDDNHWFYNPDRAGLYCYRTSKKLFKHFYAHLEAFHHTHPKPKTALDFDERAPDGFVDPQQPYLCIERYNPFEMATLNVDF